MKKPHKPKKHESDSFAFDIKIILGIIALGLLKYKQKTLKKLYNPKAHYTPDDTSVTLKARRSQLAFSLRYVAEMTGVAASTISRIEAGRPCEHGNVVKLIKFYHTCNKK
ncbi:MAG: hypothetical protein UT21_C0006G0011 [Candidatus Woesebacteria bacterium GW2011_GWA1_39_11b]|nr:MAG: hypothetical protein UT21_C0006G0011 [Candidatus Woesebacteria bacterium GW2011_GWA1_39_11b]